MNWILAGFLFLLFLPLQALQAQCPNPITVEINLEEPDCHNDGQGKVTGIITGGTPPYTVILSGKVDARITINSDGGSYLFGGLVGGNYTITVRDANYSNSSGCSISESFFINQPPKLILEVSGESISCSGGADGKITGKISGGTPPYSILLNGAPTTPTTTVTPSGINFEISGLSVGSYFIRVIDANYFSSGNGAGCTTFNVVMVTTSGNDIETELDIAICEGESYQLGTQTLTTSGMYKETFTSSTSCDSIVTVNLLVGAGKETALDIEICEGESYQLGTQTLTTSGTYKETFTTGTSCDSIVTVNLLVGAGKETALDIAICDGGSYQLGTQTLTTSGTYKETFTSNTGCDSIVTVNLLVGAGQPFELIALPMQDTVCEGGAVPISVEIDGGVPEYQILWYDNLDGTGTPIGSTETISVSPVIGINSYLVKVSDASGCTLVDTSTIAIVPIDVMVSPQDTSICEDTEEVTLRVTNNDPNHRLTYEWQPENAIISDPFGPEVRVDPAGSKEFFVKVTDQNGCEATLTSTISFIPVDAEISPQDTSVCDDTEEILLKVRNNDSRQKLNYEWQPANAIISDPFGAEVLVDLSMSTEFFVQLTNQNGCNATLTSTIKRDACSPLRISADPMKITPGGNAVLTVTACNGCTYLWSSGQVDSTIIVNPQITTTYSVSVTTAEGCECDILEQTVEVNDCIIDPEDFFIPTAFTPDGDQVNDELCVRSVLETAPSDAVDILLIIYNRWGQEVFRGTSFSDCWDGTYQGTPLAPDVYAYYLKVMCPDDTYIQNGDVTILR